MSENYKVNLYDVKAVHDCQGECFANESMYIPHEFSASVRGINFSRNGHCSLI
jgi:hypothetical protein